MELKQYIKLSYVTGLKDVVLDELKQHPLLTFSQQGEGAIYVDFADNLQEAKKMRSVLRAHLVVQDAKLNPVRLSNHKSVIGSLIDAVISEDKSFESFKLICAGSDTPQIQAIAEYIAATYGLIQQEEADLKVHIVKIGDLWEAGVQITPRPLAVRAYRTRNMSGAMDPTIAFAVNIFCELEKKETYLNAFSGSGTLLIEAALAYPNLKTLVGFDNDKEHLSLSIKNIKKAGLIKRIQVKEADIFDKPELGKFDVITADLPFGMLLSKGEDLTSLYKCFVEYCEGALNEDGILAVYTTEHKLFEKLILDSKFSIDRTVDLKFMSAVNAYLYPRIIIARLR
jgi:23S rRNA G2445 N2-methylase RlmL